MKINSVCIIGGGSSGWMTAALLSYNLPNLKISVIEPKDIPTIGVGESTLGHINRYLYYIGLLGKDKEWMPKCNASYKISIQFTDFKKLNSKFQYPFGQIDHTNKTLEDWYYLKHLSDQCPNFANFYNPISYLADTNKMVADNKLIRNYNFNMDTAYHFDAVLFGNYLKENICIPNGVKVLRDSVKQIFKTEEGNIDFLVLENSPLLKVQADLFIDCTGFNSLILEKEMKSKFISFNDVLLNDTAIATRIPFVNKEIELHNVTDCHALKNGWVWNIPLWNRIGTGYCFSSQFISDDLAEQEFRSHLSKVNKDRAEKAEIFKINIRHGKRERAWVKNVVGIGLSYGFLEPLESTGLLTTHENALRLLSVIQRRNGIVNKIDIDGYNSAVDSDIESMKDFIVMHYTLSERNDSNYWRHVTNSLQPMKEEQLFDRVVRSPRLYQEFIHGVNSANSIGNLDGLLYIAGGMEYNPLSKSECKYRLSDGRYLNENKLLNETLPLHLKYEKQILKRLQKEKSTFEFLRDYIYVE